MKNEVDTPVDSVKSEDTNSLSSEKPKTTAVKGRRTKTGCLTCRGRRIKCDEARPICNNCIKSRRDCRGYQPPIRLPAVAPTQEGYPIYPQNLMFPDQQGSQAPWHQYPLSQPPSFPINSYATGVALGQFPADLPQHPRYDWSVPSDISGLTAYEPNLNAMYPDYTHIMRDPNHVVSSLPQQASQIPFSPYPDHASSGGLADHEKSSSRSFPPPPSPPSLPPAVHHHQYQRLPAYFHSFSFAYDDEDPDDPWDIETEDGFPWYHLSVALQRRVASAASPLLHEKSSLLLHHFINILRPCVYLYERRPILDGNGRIISSWGNSLPSAAISFPALGHAILGLSSLHLAILHGNSDATAKKHILRSTKSMGKVLSDPGQRQRVEVLACVLLLAFYEVMDADHCKWVMHLSGAALFLNSEHDWAGMTRSVYQMRARANVALAKAKVGHRQVAWSEYVRIAAIPELLLSEEDWDVDQTMLSKLTGRKIDYLDGVASVHSSEPSSRDFTSQEVDEVVTKMELFWWLTKQMIFQSLLSGDPLLAPYEKLLSCPPRGRLGSNVIGTVDHLWLVLARLADFGGRDRLRKQKQKGNEANGRKLPDKAPFPIRSAPPHSSENKAGRRNETGSEREAPSANERRARAPQALPNAEQSGAPKMFHGMIPPATVPKSMMHSFHIMDAQLQKNSVNRTGHITIVADNSDLDQQFAAAMAEHTSIGEALESWWGALGDQYKAMQSHVGELLTTPFGPAIRFNDPVVACTWAFYYLAKIMLRRFHPHSPPAMIISAIANAHHTKDDALLMLRIYWGVILDQKQTAEQGFINPIVLAALQELSFPLIFTAVHVEEPHQRAALIESFMDMEREAGWKSASASASACESFWFKMGQVGKGPPYERTVNHTNYSSARRSNHQARSSAIVTHYNHVSEHENRFVSRDRELIDKYAEVRTYWAMGMLSLDEDLEKIRSSK